MKIKTFLLILAYTCMAVSASAGNGKTYEQLWNEVKSVEKSDLPRNGIKLCDEIYAKANAENNGQQMLKAFLHRMDLRSRIDNDSIEVDISFLKNWQQREKRPVMESVLSYLLAKYQSSNNNNNDDSLKLAYIRESLKYRDDLASTISTTSWQELITKGSKSDYFAHDMYNLMVHSNIELLYNHNADTQRFANDIYHKAITFYSGHNNRDGELVLILDSLNYASSQGLNNDSYHDRLNLLKKEFADSPVCAQVYLELANKLMNSKNYIGALDLLNEAISKYPSYTNINELKNEITTIKRPETRISGIPNILYPGDQLKITATYRNISELQLNNKDINVSNDNKHIKCNTYKFALKTNNDYSQNDTALTLPALSLGKFSLSAKGSDDNADINVTRLFVLNRKIEDNNQIVVLDGKTGYPVKDAKVNIVYGNDDKENTVATYTTDVDGICSFTLTDKNKNYFAKVSKGDDKAFPKISLGYYYGYYYNINKSKGESTTMQLFTDRAVYRPGQTIQVKGVAYTQTGDDAVVCPGKPCNVRLHDNNGKIIAENKVTTNDFGSFSTQFTLPANILNGGCFIDADEKGVTTIRVEEYKRPTFEVKINEYKQAYKMGESVHLAGTAKTYSGLAMENDSVKYKVTRSARVLWWWRQGNQSDVETQTGYAHILKDGSFDLPVTLVPDSTYDMYDYTVAASVTDVNGETEKAEYTLSAGKKSVMLSTDIPDEVDVDSVIEGKFIATNLQNNEVAETIKARLLHSGKEVWNDDRIPSNTTVSLKKWKSLKPGKYILQISDSISDKPLEKALVIFSEYSSVMPVDTVVWCKQLTKEFPKDGKPATILYGTSHPSTYVICSVFNNGKLLESKHITLNNEMHSFNYTYDDKYGEGIFVQFCFVVDEKSYQNGFTITKPLPDKSLSLKWSRFRDKLQPGKKETWSLTILNNKKAPANAEMMAVLYDASLDAFERYSPNNKIYYSRYVPECTWNELYLEPRSFWLSYPQNKTLPQNYLYDRFNFKSNYIIGSPFGNNILNEVVTIGYGTKSMSAAVPRMAKQTSRTSFVSEDKKNIMIRGTRSTESSYPEQPAPTISTQSLRSNFNETAFFYPQLRTDADGNITFSFTMPESLTRWNFIGLAHTKDMQIGSISGSTVTAKDFMITPNLPRFVRVGDKASISARINNTGNTEVEGKATMQLFNPENDEVISTQTVSFDAPKQNETSVAFSFNPTERYPLLGVKIIAEGGNFSDGEQHLLPVLSNKEYVTETVPMFVRGRQTKTFDISSLFNHHSQTATQRKMMVECTSNPAWYAVQALPTLSNPSYDDAISWGTAWYANSLATYIANSNPRIKQIFDAWHAEGTDSKTLWSKLQKDEDVKNILLDESPWVAEANSQQEQQQRVATLFDVNNMTYQLAHSINKLKQLQQYDGGWAWFPGMKSGLYTTMYIVKLMSRYNQLTGNSDATTSDMIRNGMAFIHKNIKKEYDECIKDKVKPWLGDTQIEYLYLCALNGNDIPQNAHDAYDYYIKSAEKSSPNLTMLGKTVVSYVMKSAHKDKIAATMIESLRQYAVRTEDGGAFYNPSADHYSWWGNPLATQSAAIEAFSKVAHDSTFVDELQIALLKRKQAQSWGNTVSTANAVYALLCNGNNMLANNGKCTLTLKGNSVNETIQPEKQETGTGYYRTEITDEKARDNATSIKFEKEDAGIAWGAVYGGSLENIGKFANSGNALTVTKTYLLNGKPLSEWHVGDRITTHLTIHVDRDMDYVQINDERPACAEPGIVTSGYRWSNGIGYYQCFKDASTRIFMDRLRKGTYTIDYDCTIDRTGSYQSGLTTLQSAYAPEFAAHSTSTVISVK